MTYFYEAYGLILGSEIALPELSEQSRSWTGEPDIAVRWGKAADGTCERDGYLYGSAGHQDATFASRGVGNYRVRAGSEILVEAAEGADQAVVRLYILGSAMALAFHQRGMVALHASAVAFDGVAVAFAGDQGQGKSTLAAHCLAGGDAVLVADDVLVVALDAAGRPVAYPGIPTLKLWRAALASLERGTDGLRADWFRAEKFHLPAAERFATKPTPLSCVYVLDSAAAADGDRIDRLSGAAALDALLANSYRLEALEDHVQRPHHFRAVTRIARALDVCRLARSRDLAKVNLTAATIRDRQKSRGKTA